MWETSEPDYTYFLSGLRSLGRLEVSFCEGFRMPAA